LTHQIAGLVRKKLQLKLSENRNYNVTKLENLLCCHSISSSFPDRAISKLKGTRNAPIRSAEHTSENTPF